VNSSLFVTVALSRRKTAVKSLIEQFEEILRRLRRLRMTGFFSEALRVKWT
jgi:hypothetical protein